jgi:D-glycero-D-manno-heptose 1,7-bisphosphate phosphatase
VVPSLERARQAGFALVCCTNQPDVGRGLIQQEKVDEINEFMMQQLGLDGFEVCFSGDDADPRRKPNTGMMTDAADRLGIDLRQSWMIGDRWRDIEAGRRAGCLAVLIDRGYSETWPVAPAENVVYALAEAIDLILTGSW